MTGGGGVFLSPSSFSTMSIVVVVVVASGVDFPLTLRCVCFQKARTAQNNNTHLVLDSTETLASTQWDYPYSLNDQSKMIIVAIDQNVSALAIHVIIMPRRHHYVQPEDLAISLPLLDEG